MRTFDTLEELDACVGQPLASSDWITITQEQVNRFAEARRRTSSGQSRLLAQERFLSAALLDRSTARPRDLAALTTSLRCALLQSPDERLTRLAQQE